MYRACMDLLSALGAAAGETEGFVPSELMILEREMRWLIAYDVVKPARLQRIYRLLCGHALPFQESGVLLRGTQADFEVCYGGLVAAAALAEG